jgi:hypothetical protein
MDSNVLVFPGAKPPPALPGCEPNPDAVRLLEEMLVKVRSGVVVGVAMVTVEPAGVVGTVFTDGPHYHHLTSGAAMLLARMTR